MPILRLYRDAFSGLPAHAWRISFAFLINRAGTMVVPFLTLYLTLRLGFSKVDAGTTLAAYGVGSLLGSYLGGILSVRIGSIAVMIGSLLSTGATFLVLAPLRSFPAIVALVVVLGVCAEAFRPAAMSALADASPPGQLTRTMALCRLAINLGMAIGPVLGGLLARYDYALLFYVDAATCWLAAVFLIATRMPARLHATTAAADGTVGTAPPPIRWSVWGDRSLLLFVLTNLVLGLVFFQFFASLPLYYHEGYGLDEGGVGLLFSLNCVVIVLIEMAIVHLLRHRDPVRIYGLGALLVCTGFGLTGCGSSFGFVAFTVVIWTFGEIFTGSYAAAVIGMRAPPHARGAAMGLFAMAMAAAQLIGPPLGMWVYQEFGPQTLWRAILCMGPPLWYLSHRMAAHLGSHPGTYKKI